jgi:hypothetical protein
MARRKKPEDETVEQERERRIFESIANFSDRSEKTSWNRKMDNMVKLLAKLRPIEDQIIELQAQKMPVFDEVQELREVMVKECVHPYQHLVLKEDHVECKFCNKRIRIPDEFNEETQT